MPCYRCGTRQTDPEPGQPSPWHRGLAGQHQVLVCPDCYPAAVGALARCPRCDSVRLVRRLDQVECLDCHRREIIDDPADDDPADDDVGAEAAGTATAPADTAPAATATASAGHPVPTATATPDAPAAAAPAAAATRVTPATLAIPATPSSEADALGDPGARSPDPALAEEVARALDRILGRADQGQ